MQGLSSFEISAYANAFIMIVIGLAMVAVYLTRTTYPGFPEWIAAPFVGAAGVVLLALRGSLSLLVTVLLANTLILIGIALVYDGLCVFAGRKRNKWIHVSAALVFFPAMVYLTYVVPSLRMRTAVITITVIIYCASSLDVILRRIRSQFGTNLLFEIGFSVELIWNVVRTIAIFATGRSAGPATLESTFVIITMLLSITTNLFVLVGLSVLNFQRTERELLTSRSELSTLRGIIPICASCKRIRDDEGYWNAVESYISKHTQAEFSHSICPDCRAKLFPGLKSGFDV